MAIKYRITALSGLGPGAKEEQLGYCAGPDTPPLGQMVVVEGKPYIAAGSRWDVPSLGTDPTASTLPMMTLTLALADLSEVQRQQFAHALKAPLADPAAQPNGRAAGTIRGSGGPGR